MELIKENQLGRVEYDRLNSTIYATYEGMVNPELGMELFHATMEYVENNRVVAICSDTTLLTGTFTHVNDFLTQTYFPHLIKHGVICIAMIVSADVFTRFATKDLIKKMGSMTLQTFKSESEAVAWMEEVINRKHTA